MFVKNEMPYRHLFSFIQPYFVARLFLPQANFFPGLAFHGLSKLHNTLTLISLGSLYTEQVFYPINWFFWETK